MYILILLFSLLHLLLRFFSYEVSAVVQSINNDGTYRIEHIHRTDKNFNLKWRYPSKEDIADVEEDQILDCDIDGDWDVLSNRNNEFSLRNHEFINEMFIDVQRNV